MKPKNSIDRIKETLLKQGQSPRAFFVVLVAMYFFTNYYVRQAAQSMGAFMLFGEYPVPISAFTGVISSIGNICIIFLVVLYKKMGYFAALLILLFQFPGLIQGLFANRGNTSIPGIFTNLFTIFAITLIFLNHVKISKYQKSILDQAVTDYLTGLPNRYGCDEFMNDLIKQNKKFAMVSIDINSFKSINNSLGQNIGNNVLREVATRWKDIADNGTSGTLDFIARHGGDEFTIIIREFAKPEDVLKTIQAYRKTLEASMISDEYEFYITASFGYAFYPEDGTTIDAISAAADAAMYEIKSLNSSDHVLRFTKDMLKTDYSLAMEREIRAALDNNTVYFNLQPQFDMDHKLRGFEALARMKNVKGEFISPGEFVPIAEKFGLIDKIDGTIFRQAAGFISEAIKETKLDITLSVNVSVRHLMKNGFLDEVKDILLTTGLAPRNLELEITESIMIDSYEKALQCVNDIRDMGIKIAIDDFGTGYSSLSYLHKFPADLLKVDKAFIDKMNSGESSKQYVSSIISIGHLMNFEVIAEGVEEGDQLATLKDIGCDYIQGYLWGRPLSAEDARKVIDEAVA